MSDQRSRVCPYLGLEFDTNTHMGFPSDENLCFHRRRPTSPNLSHQQSFCLRTTYEQCQAYQQKPKHASMHANSKRALSKLTISMLVMLILVLTTLGVIINANPEWRELFSNILPSFQESPVEPSIPISPNAPATLVPTSVPETFIVMAETTAVSMDTPVPQETKKPTLTVEATQTSDSQLSQHRFEITKMPPGSKQGYLVHVVSVGETLDMIADDYNTSVQAILMANYNLKPPVWAQYPIVIPVNSQDTAGLVAFDVHVVDGYESIDAESLADILGVNAAALEFYNLCTDNCRFNKGDVLLVPHID